MEYENNRGVLMLAAGRFRQALHAFTNAMTMVKHLADEEADTDSVANKMLQDRPLHWKGVQESLLLESKKSPTMQVLLRQHPWVVSGHGICLVAHRSYASTHAADLQVRSAAIVFNMALCFHWQSLACCDKEEEHHHTACTAKALRLYLNAGRLLQYASRRLDDYNASAPQACFVDLLSLSIQNNLEVLRGAAYPPIPLGADCYADQVLHVQTRSYWIHWPSKPLADLLKRLDYNASVIHLLSATIAAAA